MKAHRRTCSCCLRLADPWRAQAPKRVAGRVQSLGLLRRANCNPLPLLARVGTAGCARFRPSPCGHPKISCRKDENDSTTQQVTPTVSATLPPLKSVCQSVSYHSSPNAA